MQKNTFAARLADAGTRTVTVTDIHGDKLIGEFRGIGADGYATIVGRKVGQGARGEQIFKGPRFYIKAAMAKSVKVGA